MLFDDIAMQPTHLFIGGYHQPRFLMAEFDDWRVFDFLKALRRIIFSGETIYELMHNEVCRPETSGGFGVTKSIVKEKF